MGGLLERIGCDNRFLSTNLGVNCDLRLLSLLLIFVLTATIDIVSLRHLAHWSFKCLG